MADGNPHREDEAAEEEEEIDETVRKFTHELGLELWN